MFHVLTFVPHLLVMYLTLRYAIPALNILWGNYLDFPYEHCMSGIIISFRLIAA